MDTFERRVSKTFFENAITKYLQGKCDVERLVGITDYEEMFSGTVANMDIKGISHVHTFRITAKPNGTGVNVYYKSNFATEGWYPRPAPAVPCELWNDLFPHPLSRINQGNIG